MPHDPARIAEAHEWLQKAAIDLRGAHLDLEAQDPLLEDALFHCQQVVEKCLKAHLAWHDVPFRKTHSLEELGAASEKLDPSLKTQIDPAVPLTQYAWALRYPGELPEPTFEEARQALRIAVDLARAIVNLIPSDAIPSTLAKQLG